MEKGYTFEKIDFTIFTKRNGLRGERYVTLKFDEKGDFLKVDTSQIISEKEKMFYEKIMRIANQILECDDIEYDED